MLKLAIIVFAALALVIIPEPGTTATGITILGGLGVSKFA